MPLSFRVAIRSGFVALLMLLCATATAANDRPAPPAAIDIFIDYADSVHELDRVSRTHPKIEIRIYQVTGIERLEMHLSKGLPSDPAAAKRQALQRLSTLDDTARDRLKHSAIGLAEAARLGVTHYPAIVFDSQNVIYGTNDISRALETYHRWQGGAR